MIGISVLLALTLGMMVPAVVLKDSVFKNRPWLLYLLSSIMAFGIEVDSKRMYLLCSVTDQGQALEMDRKAFGFCCKSETSKDIKKSEEYYLYIFKTCIDLQS